jgi:light-independent protochlorophyllide reductase subunit B
MGATPADIARLARRDFNVVLYPETGEAACALAGTRPSASPTPRPCRSAWAPRAISSPKWRAAGVDPSASDDELSAPALVVALGRFSTYLTGKRVFVFGDATHVIAAARVARDEMGFEVVGLGCYNREFARDPRAAKATASRR